MKLYKCKECLKAVPIRSKGLCSYCRVKERRKNGELTFNSTKVSNPDRSKYFSYHVKKVRNAPICENCGINIKPNVSVIAHILPKRKTANPEVGTNLINAMYLCSSLNGENGCHDLYDRIQGNTDVYKMKVWETALARYIMFRDRIERKTPYVEVFESYLKNNDI